MRMNKNQDVIIPDKVEQHKFNNEIQGESVDTEPRRKMGNNIDTELGREVTKNVDIKP